MSKEKQSYHEVLVGMHVLLFVFATPLALISIVCHLMLLGLENKK